MQHTSHVDNAGIVYDPTSGNHDQDVNDAINGTPSIDVTKSLYHLQLHGFDMIAKNYQGNSGASSPTRIACVTPAVSPAHDVHSYRKRPSRLQQGSITPTITSRPLSPIFLDITPTRTRRLNSVPPRKQVPGERLSTVTTCSPSNNNFDKANQTGIYPGLLHSIATENVKSSHRMLPTTITDVEDEFEVMLESSVSSDESDDGSKSTLRNESIITDSPQSLPTFTENENDQDRNDDASFDDCGNKVSPNTPATFNFCGIPSWCYATTTNSTSRHLFLDDCSTANSFQLQHRSTGEWLVCPSSTTGCCISTLNDTDPSVVHPGSRQITVVQHMLQHHICTSLGDSIESLCWQKTATSVMSKSLTGKGVPLDSIGAETKRMKNKHRRSSTLPIHRRVDEFASLQYNLHPFDSSSIDPLRDRKNMPHTLTKSQSFQQTSKHCKSQPRATSANNTKVYSQSDVGLVSTEWECGVLDFASAFESSDELNKSSGNSGNIGHSLKNSDSLINSDTGYESDPEIICRTAKSDQLNKQDPNPLLYQPSHTLQEFLNERNTFILHTTSSKSIAVHVWKIGRASCRERV